MNDFLNPSNSKIRYVKKNLDITKGQGTTRRHQVVRSKEILLYIHRGSFLYICFSWGKESRSLYRWLFYIEIRYMEVALYNETSL